MASTSRLAHLAGTATRTYSAHKRVLVANRGEIALRIMRACAAEGAESVAVFAREDAASAHVKRASTAVRIGHTDDAGGSVGGAVAPYLDVDQIVGAALSSGATAVHPGYGFLSESAALARACREAGVAFVGPPPEALAAFGDKVEARRRAVEAGVPVAIGSGNDHVFADGGGVRRWMRDCGVAFPLMLKAAFGGGGRGMRVVREDASLDDAFARCASEAKASFGDGRVFAEEFVGTAKHLEVQVLWDSFGNGVHLWERDCSVQRRNQKVVEWAPARGLDATLRDRLTSSALELTRGAGYVGAATVEFLVDGPLSDSSTRAYFMEVNPRIQVEHTVTEEAFGVDLVRAQLRIAGGARLEDISGMWPQASIAPKKWAVQCRVSAAPPRTTAEMLSTFTKYAEPPDARVDSAGDPWQIGDAPSTAYDPLLAKLIVATDYDSGFEHAIAATLKALDAFSIEGVANTLPQLRRVLAHGAFAADAVNTRFLEDVLDVEAAEVEEDDFETVTGPCLESVVSAPMAGAVVDVLKRAGDSVRQGEVVAVVSAMKIEMELKSEVDGVVVSVSAAKGAQVESGAHIVLLEGTRSRRVKKRGLSKAGGVYEDFDASAGPALNAKGLPPLTRAKPPLVWRALNGDGDAGVEALDDDEVSAAAAFVSVLDPNSATFQERDIANRRLAAELLLCIADAASGGRDRAISRHRDRGKRLPRERIAHICDAGAEVLELSPLAAFGMYGGDVPSAGIVTAVGPVGGRAVMFIANDASVKGGTYHPTTVKKHLRAQAIAAALRLPCVSLVDSGGAFLPLQAEVFPDREHFGRIFFNQARLSAAGVPQIACVLGSCTAGGAYVPAMADEAIIVRGNGTIFLAGPPLVEAATGERVSAEELGGADTHARLSGVADHAADDEDDALRKVRELLAQLPEDEVAVDSRGSTSFARFDEAPNRWELPKYSAESIYGVLPTSTATQYDPRELLARIVDGSRLSEFKREYGPTIVTAFATIAGERVGVVANCGVLTGAAATKAAHFVELCGQRRTTLLFVQNSTGFAVGRDAERSGIAKDGAKLVAAVACASVPKLTLLVGASFGAANYGMCGRAYDPDLLFAYPNSRIAVMGPQQAAATLLTVKQAALQQQGLSKLDADEQDNFKRPIEAMFEDQASPYYATARLWDDGIIDPVDTRAVLARALRLAARKAAPPSGRSVFRF